MDKDLTVAAIDYKIIIAVAASKAETHRRDAVGRVKDGDERDPLVVLLEDPEKWRLPVVVAEAAGKLWVGDEALPAPADGGGAREGGWLRRESE
jgi:hypothetical protein